MKLFRIEHINSANGMWTTMSEKNKPFVTHLTNRIVAELPMPFNERYGLHGRRWYSSADSLEMLDYWFNLKDINELIKMGFRVYEIEAHEYAIHEKEFIFTKESVIQKTDITQNFINEFQKNKTKQYETF